MNNIDILNINNQNQITEYLNGKELYEYSKTYKINGQDITRLIEYCKENDIFDDLYAGEDVYEYQKMIDFDNTHNLPFLREIFKLKYFSDTIKSTKEHVFEFIKKDPYNLRYANVKFLDDKDIILLVIGKYWGIIIDISERLTDDDEILQLALDESKYAINYASDRIKSMYPDIVREITPSNSPPEKFEDFFGGCVEIKGGNILKDKYYLDETLSDDKYVQMRKEHYDECKLLDKEVYYGTYLNNYDTGMYENRFDRYYEWDRSKWDDSIYIDLKYMKKKIKRIDYVIPENLTQQRNKLVNYLGEYYNPRYNIIKLTEDSKIYVRTKNSIFSKNINDITSDDIIRNISISNFKNHTDICLNFPNNLVIDIRDNVNELLKTKIIEIGEKYFKQIVCFTTEKN
jgi:hypothetical protein